MREVISAKHLQALLSMEITVLQNSLYLLGQDITDAIAQLKLMKCVELCVRTQPYAYTMLNGEKLLKK